MTDEELIKWARARADRMISVDRDMVTLLANRIEALTEQLVAARDDAKEAEAYAEELEKERDDYAHKLMQANNTYTEMHLEIERLSDKLATCEKYRDAYAEMGRIGTQAVRDLEAKLAKAVEAADKMLDAFCVHEDSHQIAAYEAMCATLAEISSEAALNKGESHECA
jgi:chromosome segregation ATPase